jgi:hypothetical protein
MPVEIIGLHYLFTLISLISKNTEQAMVSMTRITSLPARTQFRLWLQTHPAQRKGTLRKLIDRSGLGVSLSAAYRAARDLGLRGKRRNRSRYDEFWRSLDWRLPDSSLASIWNVARGNIRNRRMLMGIGAPRWQLRRDARDPAFIRASEREQDRARQYVGQTPS